MIWQRDDIIQLLLEAGRLAVHFRREPGARHKADGSVVTRADTAVEHLLRQELHDPAQGRWVIGEEGEDRQPMAAAELQRAMEQNAFIVDPIDGTAPYANGLPNWGISIGLAQHATMTEGAVYLPATGELYVSDGDRVFLAAVRDDEVDRLAVLEPQPAPGDRMGMIALSQVIAKHGRVRLPNPVQAIGSAVVPLTYLLQGRYLAYYGTLKLWDLAGAWPLLWKAGFEGILLDGRPLAAAINEDVFVLQAGDSNRWKLRESCLFGPTGTAARILPFFEVEESDR